jgi:hypothetical protein
MTEGLSLVKSISVITQLGILYYLFFMTFFNMGYPRTSLGGGHDTQ